MPIPGLEATDAIPARLSPDEFTLYSNQVTPPDIWVAHRSTLTGAFGPPTFLTAQNSASFDGNPTVSSDGLTLWLQSNRVANQGYHLYVTTRTSTLVEFGTPGLAATVNAADPTKNEYNPFVTTDGSELWFSSDRTGGVGGQDIWYAKWTGNGFGPPTPVPELNASGEDWFPTLSADRLTIYFGSIRTAPGTKGSFDIWTSHRSTVNDGFPAPTLVNELNTPNAEVPTWVSGDNCRLYGGLLNSSGAFRLFVATRQP
jgi:Tol biopolymer transport system component